MSREIRGVPGGDSAGRPDPDRTAPPPEASDVTVLIPVHNGASTLAECLDSARIQDPRVAHILLVDDGSTDGSPQLGRHLAAQDPRVEWRTNGRNLGLAATLNAGFAAARGDYVLVLHQDCVLGDPAWIRRALDSFLEPSVIAVVGYPRHDIARMGWREKEFWIIRQHIALDDAPTGGPRLPPLFSENKCDLFRRREILDLGGFDERLKEGGEDQVLAWRLRATPWKVTFRYDLSFGVYLAQGTALAPHLRREASYGRQMRQILRITGGKAIRRSQGGGTDPRVRNRVLGILWIIASIVGAALYVLVGDPWLLALVVAPPLLRWVEFSGRAYRVRSPYHLSMSQVATIGPVGLLADAAYAVGTVTPARRSSSATGQTTSPPSKPSHD